MPGARLRPVISPVYDRTSESTICHRAASVSSRAEGSYPARRPCSVTIRAAYEWYVATVGSPASASCCPRRRTNCPSLVRTRWASSPAALRVNVRPRISSGWAYPFATSQTTREAIVSVLPDPAPATTRTGSTGAAMIAACSGVGACSRSSLASSSGV
ncbi:hypothetical protein Asp14428_57540 [Actinoplanes sp. NBRC 14428]|nr:hypothetical protein Asp14428_57540 [Actinoplanes sp. NBRC 14428]